MSNAANDLATALLRDLKVAVSVFTRVPVPADPPIAMAELARAWRLVPVVGVVIGFAGGLVYATAHKAGLSPFLAALVAVAATGAATGALHEDGLADFADGLGGGKDRDERLAIMRDGRIGAYGALALIFSVGLRAGAIATISKTAWVIGALVAAHAVSRALLALVADRLNPARPDGLAVEAGKPERQSVGIALVLAPVIGVTILGLGPGIVAMAFATLAAGLVAYSAGRLLDGYTGDVLGAAQQVAEIAMLIAIASVLGGAR